jgi:putative membrane protein insertion efficiency factor
MSRLLIGLIRAYRYLLSPWIGNQCRFHPSCSHYGEQAIQQHGAIKGSGLTVWRILRCNPWHPGGFDYVPDTETVPERKSEPHLDQHKNITGVSTNEF